MLIRSGRVRAYSIIRRSFTAPIRMDRTMFSTALTMLSRLHPLEDHTDLPGRVPASVYVDQGLPCGAPVRQRPFPTPPGEERWSCPPPPVHDAGQGTFAEPCIDPAENHPPLLTVSIEKCFQRNDVLCFPRFPSNRSFLGWQRLTKVIPANWTGSPCLWIGQG